MIPRFLQNQPDELASGFVDDDAAGVSPPGLASDDGCGGYSSEGDCDGDDGDPDCEI